MSSRWQTNEWDLTLIHTLNNDFRSNLLFVTTLYIAIQRSLSAYNTAVSV